MKFTLFAIVLFAVTAFSYDDDHKRGGCRIETFSTTITTLTATTTTVTEIATVTPTFNNVGCVYVDDAENDDNLIAQGISYQKDNMVPNMNGYTTKDCLNYCLSIPNTLPSYFCLSFYQTGGTPTDHVNFYCNCRTILPTASGDNCISLTIRGGSFAYGQTTNEDLHGDIGTEECYLITI